MGFLERFTFVEWGSVIAVMASFISLAQSRRAIQRDRATLCLRAVVITESILADGGPFLSDAAVSSALMLRVTNIGRRPARLRYICGRSFGTSPVCYYQFVIRAPELVNKRIEEANELVAYFPLTQQLKNTLKSLIVMEVVDSRGDRLRLSRRELRYLKKTLKFVEPIASDTDGRPFFMIRRPIFSYLFDKLSPTDWFPNISQYGSGEKAAS